MPVPAQHAIDLDDETEALDADELRLLAEPAIPARLTVPTGSEGERLDKALAQLLPAVSRSRIKQWIEEGAVRLNDRIPAPRAQVLAGDTIDLAPPPSPQATAFRAEPIALDVVHADDSILVLDKPPGLVVHPGAGNWSGTLLNGLLAYDTRQGRLPRAGIVHRLDAETSGLMVVARTAAAQVDLVRQLQARSVTREYWAIVHGTAAPDGTIDAGIARDPRQPLRFKVSSGARAKPARTRYRRIEVAKAQGPAFSWLACRLETGRTHQIRVHLAEHGHPILADVVYGRSSRDERVLAAIEAIGRQALHARLLGFRHPVSGEPLRFEAEPPDEFLRALALLRP